MVSKVVSLLLLIIFAVGFLAEVEAADDVETPAPIESVSYIQSANHVLAHSDAPYDDCCEGAACQGHCHFGMCLSVLLAFAPQISSVTMPVTFQAYYVLPVMSGYVTTLFRPPIS